MQLVAADAAYKTVKTVGRVATIKKSDYGIGLLSWADWAAWHLPGGPVGPPSRWAATSNVEVKRLTRLTGGADEARAEKGAGDKVTKQRREKEGVEQEIAPRNP